MDFKTYVRDIQDFPEKGIVFKDISPLLKDERAFQAATKAMIAMVGNNAVDKVIGIESRGFFFAPLLAFELSAGFVPVRKVGKLPADKISRTYALEYGSDTLEIHSDSITKGDRVLIHDDVLATGGTARAACELVESLGGEVVLCHFLLELDFLNGRRRLENYPAKSLMAF
ncbi:adenine phosphoribosyltransferase [Lentiprolixibacter aurantiacus]|uniref:Adenine phosphoribosyltransferase n=1 Tax=Lentiprolixibacter aurantiacus TaxID=2993939 RepID=A0AAE3SP78_9FLAO|nr:adenine phosphoribosyltransferase [Lentiprolixibacter aurantiacus]MCX2720552.1 adenine phosphoribosyltransferase [Lentiprolixibacter aurantiacus]